MVCDGLLCLPWTEHLEDTSIGKNLLKDIFKHESVLGDYMENWCEGWEGPGFPRLHPYSTSQRGSHRGLPPHADHGLVLRFAG